MKRKGLILFTLLLLSLSACKNNDMERLRIENEDLQVQVSTLEEENAALRAELDNFQTEMNKLDDREDNPIDRFYDAVETDGSTASMNAVAYSCVNAWEAETRNLAEQLKSQLPLTEDKDLVDAYLTAVEEQIERMDIMAIYPVSDLELSQEERPASSGTLRGVLWAGSQAELWRDTFYQIYRVLPYGGYDTFLFDPEAVNLELP